MLIFIYEYWSTYFFTVPDNKLDIRKKCLFVCNRGTTFVARRAPIEGARPIPFTGASSNLTPQHLFGQGAFRCCPELSMTIWSAYISLEQVYLGLLGHFDPTLHPQVGMAPHMRCQIDHRGSADASSRPYVHY